MKLDLTSRQHNTRISRLKLPLHARFTFSFAFEFAFDFLNFTLPCYSLYSFNSWPNIMAAADPAIAPAGDACPIKELSIEVFLRVTFWLRTPDLCSVRLVCRAFHDFLHDSFIKEFIERKQFMISPFSLEGLVDLTKSPMGRHLRRLQFGTDNIRTEDSLSFQTRGTFGEAHRLVSAQRTFIDDGSHRKLLSEAFRNLRELPEGLQEDFVLVIRDFNSRRRTRDATKFTPAEWNSYGARTAQNAGAIVEKGNMFGRCSVTTGSVFRWLLVACADAGICPNGIEVMTKHWNHLDSESFTMNPHEPGVAAVLAGLKKLHLALGNHPRNNPIPVIPDGPNLGQRSDLRSDFPEFISHCVNLKELRINLQQSFSKLSENLFVWLGTPVSPAPDPSPQPWPMPAAFGHLETLSLGMTTTWPSTLHQIVVKLAPTLRSLGFWRVTLLARCGPISAADVPEPKLWKNFLNNIASINGLGLQHILLGNLSEVLLPESSGVEELKRSMTFKGHYMHEYRGSDWKNAVKDIVSGLDCRETQNQIGALFVADMLEPASDEDMEHSHGKTPSPLSAHCRCVVWKKWFSADQGVLDDASSENHSDED